MRKVKKCLAIVLYTLGPAFFLCMFFSPRFSYQLLDRAFSSYVTVQAAPRDCALVRRGNAHEDGIVCTLDYAANGKAASVKAVAWESESIFNTQAALHRRLAAFVQGQPVDIDIDPDHDFKRPQVVPQDWFQASAAGLNLLVFVGLFAGVGYACTTLNDAPGRRADYDYDAHGELVLKRGAGSAGGVKLPLAWLLWCLLLLAMCYLWTNRPANHRLLLGRELAPTPAILTHCESAYTGYKGHDQIECDTAYWWQGRKLRGQAEAIDFRFFPTDARLDRAVEAAEGRHVQAYVDPAQPSYAIAFVNDDIFVPSTQGLGNIMWTVIFCALTLGLIFTSRYRSR
ncbi:hypothetical protein [Achromobacter aloeverae]